VNPYFIEAMVDHLKFDQVIFSQLFYFFFDTLTILKEINIFFCYFCLEGLILIERFLDFRLAVGEDVVMFSASFFQLEGSLSSEVIHFVF
jgi:hypothetical protein